MCMLMYVSGNATENQQCLLQALPGLLLGMDMTKERHTYAPF